MTLKTPGVYIIEKSAFPNSVVEVPTAVPAFIGYTEKALDGTKDLTLVPRRISSMAEFLQCFGGPAKPAFTVAHPPPAEPVTPPQPTDARAQISHVTHNGRAYQLIRAAGQAGGRYLLARAMQHFFLNGGTACHVVSVGGYENPDGVSADALIHGITPLEQEQEPTLVLVPDAVLLPEAACIRVQQQVLAHCGGTMKNRFAILDVWGGDRPRQDPVWNWDPIAHFCAHLGDQHLSFAAAYYPWLHTSLLQPGVVDLTLLGDAAARTALASLLKADLGLDAATIAADPKAAKKAAVIDELTMPEAVAAHVNLDKTLLHRELLVLSPLYAKLVDEATAQLNLMPPSAAMAGLYTMVDETNGVWKPAANVSVAGAVCPAVNVSKDEQEDLNVTPQGKSINAIRSFVGEGALVWGARTLDGNSPEWRYIPVRRTVIMLEESCRLAAKAMVLEPNVATTWLTLKSMMSSFLNSIWKRGGLAGATPEDAFSVHCGLGETMTPEDIQAGILRVTLLVALLRPAEFLEITLEQQVQTA
jgi:phage tail sheath protein FI